nr:uncharacterized protein LOC108946565 isoform X2 [Nicotiana tomentosiformis]
MLVPQYSGVAAHVQTRSTTPATQVIEEQVQLDSTTPITDEQCEEQRPSNQTRKRGKTKMKSVHGRHEHKLILLNNLNQPVGPSDAIMIEFGSFLGTLGRNATLCPLDILDWRKMDTKEDLWEYTKENDKETSDPLSAKEVFVAIGKRKVGRSYKSSDEDTLVKLLKSRKLKHNKMKMTMSR